MNEIYIENALQKMKSPFQMNIICIDITNKCDLHCSNCTRLLKNQDKFWDMTPDNFRLAVKSLRHFPGVVAVIGGNPCMHPNFEEICKIFIEELPNKNQRGLWTNNFFKHAELAENVFGVFNLNPHNDERGLKSIKSFKNKQFYYDGNSQHSPLLAAIKDFYPEKEMWEKISDCDINQGWSASIIQDRYGELKAYFCEVAASFDLARNGDFGIKVTDGWWKKHVSEFKNQVANFCPGCGIPAKLKGRIDIEEIDEFSDANEDLAQKSVLKKKRKIIKITPENAEFKDVRVTLYNQTQIRKKKVFVYL